MLLEKQPLSVAELDAEVAIELPRRDMPLVTIVITNLLNNLRVEIDVRNVDVAAQVCAALLATGQFSCEIQQ